MIKNYFISSFRNLKKNKGYALLNILGLASGLTCFAFIALWVKDELSYDSYSRNADKIVRIVGKISTASEVFEHAVTSIPMAAALKADFPEVQNTVRMEKDETIVRTGDKQFQQQGILFTDPSFFDVFSTHLESGDAATALREPYSVVVTRSMARKYFGNEDPVGKTLTMFVYDTTGKGAPYKITGVVPDPPLNAHFTYSFLASFKTVEDSDPSSLTADGWGNNSYYTYLLLRDAKDKQKLQAQLPAFAERHIGKQMHDYQMRYDFSLQSLKDIHLHSHLRYEIEPTGDVQDVYVFSAIGIFILLIAGINYMNLATARSVQRAKEVGVKKVLGAVKRQLVFQYLSEAILLAFISLAVALLFTWLLTPLLHQLSGKNMSVFDSPQLLAFLFVITLVLGILSGLYPAFFISAYRPISVLKGSYKSTSGGTWLRKTLVILQFTISIILIVGILVVNSQLSFIRHKPLGYEPNALVALNVNNEQEILSGFEAFKNAVMAEPFVTGVTASNSVLVGGLGNSGATTVTGSGEPVRSDIYRLRVQKNFLDVYRIKLLAGRNFSENAEADSASYIVNESALRSFGWASPESAINKPFSMGGRNGRVIGVVGDFHFNSLRHAVEPVAIISRPFQGNFSSITLRIDMKHPAESLSWVEKNWKKFFPSSLYEYHFVDRLVGEQYISEARFERFFFYFSILSLLIACLGLLGLTSFATQQRVREIGIRKVLGASVPGIATLLSRDFLKLVLIAFVIAIPIAWFVMHKWLQEFAYRVDISWWIFGIAGIAAFFIAILTTGFHAIRAAIANPVKSLRTE